MFLLGDSVVVSNECSRAQLRGLSGVVVAVYEHIQSVAVQLDTDGSRKTLYVKEVEHHVDNGKANTVTKWDDCVWKPGR